MDTSLLVFGLIFGSVGFGFFLYGKQQKVVAPLVCGLALMVVPYFISNVIALCVVGIALCAVPYYFRH
jgi:hypothetical protein